MRRRLPIALAVLASACFVPDSCSYEATSPPTVDASNQCENFTCMACPRQPAPTTGACPPGMCLYYPLDQPCGCSVRCCVLASDLPFSVNPQEVSCQFDSGTLQPDASDGSDANDDVNDAGTDAVDAD